MKKTEEIGERRKTGKRLCYLQGRKMMDIYTEKKMQQVEKNPKLPDVKN